MVFLQGQIEFSASFTRFSKAYLVGYFILYKIKIARPVGKIKT